jgi:hypothetical protein
MRLRAAIYISDKNSAGSAFAVPRLKNDADANNHARHRRPFPGGNCVREMSRHIDWTMRCEAESVIDEHTIPDPNLSSAVLMMSMMLAKSFKT